VANKVEAEEEEEEEDARVFFCRGSHHIILSD
jgi:hypothetical protein